VKRFFAATFRTFLAGALGLVGSILFASAPVQQQWIARYNDAYDGLDGVYCMAVDKLGNVYVGGFAQNTNTAFSFRNTGFLTIKYDSDGNQLWEAHFEGYQTNRCEIYGIAVDTNGNVYVTGVVRAGGNNYSDIATIKYDSDGHQLWVSIFDNPVENIGPREDTPSALAIDDAANVYVTGLTYNGNQLYNTLTIKYDTDGHLLWTASYNDPFNRDDYGDAMAIDRSGNVLVLASSYGTGAGYDLVTLKYSPNGEQLWAARYSGPQSRNASGGIAADASGNVYVTGSSRRTSSVASVDFVTLKYSPSGQQLWAANYNGVWVADYNGAANETDSAKAIAVTPAGEVYVTGATRGNPDNTSDYVTLKYDRNGKQLWASRYNGPAGSEDQPAVLTLDRLGNAYVAGYSFGTNGSTEYATLKYDPNGNCRWVTRFSDPPGTSVPRAIALDPSGNVYVTGVSGNTSDIATLKYVQTDLPGLPTILSPPVSVVTLTGTDVLFSVAASPGDLEFQWSFNGLPLTGETNATLSLTAARRSQAGDYALEVRNDVGWTRTPDARVTFTSQFQSPLFTLPDAFAFTILGETGIVYQVQRSTDLLAWSPVTNLLNTLGSIRHTNSSSGAASQYFYRALKLQ
jgi:hypothetical protein